MDTMKKTNHDIIHQVPPDYYQKGISRNVLQRMWHFGKLNAVARLMDKSAPGSLLDVGCAGGWFIYELKKRFPSVTRAAGIDVYEQAVAYASGKYRDIEFVQADAHRLPFPEESFDAIVCTEVLEHVENPETVLEEIKRVMKPGGLAVIEMDTGNVFFNSVWWLWKKWVGNVWNDAHIQVFTMEKLKKMILKTGFRIEETSVFNSTMAVAFLIRKK